jgi:hypothetical protein
MKNFIKVKIHGMVYIPVVKIVLIVELMVLKKSHIIFNTSKQIDEISLYWDNNQLTVEKYHRKDKIYYCGKSLKYFGGDERTILYRILVVDVSNCCYARVYSDGEIEFVFEKQSLIMGRSKAGGQSSPRFQRIRANMINEWYKEINTLMLHEEGTFYL